MAALITFRRTNLVGQERWKSLIPLGDCLVRVSISWRQAEGIREGCSKSLKLFPP